MTPIFGKETFFTIRFPHVGKLLEEVCYERPFYGAGEAGIKGRIGGRESIWLSGGRSGRWCRRWRPP